MALRLPTPKKAPAASFIEPNLSDVQNVEDTIEFDTSIAISPLTMLNQGVNQSRFFDWQGRINRLQFLAYSTFNLLLALLILAIMYVMIGGIEGVVKAKSEQLPISLLGATGLAAVMLAYLQLAVTKRRFNDINKTGWLALLMIVPVINIFVYVYLLAVEGSDEVNYYGLPAQPATHLKTVLMVMLPLLVIALMGILMQVIVPSYQYMVNTKNSTQAPTAKAIQPANVLPANTQAVPAATEQPDNLRTEAIVITGEQLGNGVASAPQPVAQAATQPTNQPTMPATSTVDNSPTSNLSTNSPSISSETNNQADNGVTTNQATIDSVASAVKPAINFGATQGAISYEDFVKTSQQQVFIDRK